MTRLCAALRAAAFLLLLGVSALWAQVDPLNYDAWEQVATRAETAIEAGDIPTEDLEALRSDLSEYRDRLLGIQNAGDPRLTTLQSQLDALGAPPEDGSEPEEIAQRRQELQRQIGQIQAPLLRAEEAYSRARARLSEAGLDGRPALKAFVPLAFAGQRWALIAEMDQDQAFAPVRALLWQLLTLALLTIAAVALATWLVSRSVMRPLGGEPSSMAALARRLAAGELQLAGDGAAHGGLMQALQDMATAWREVIARLRQASQAVDAASGDILGRPYAAGARR